MTDAHCSPQVLAAAAEAKTAGGEAAMATVEALLSEAYKTIDMAVRTHSAA